MVNVPNDRKRRKPAVSFGRATLETREKKDALRPNAARGKAVAVPRCWGKFIAAGFCQSICPSNRIAEHQQVLIDPEKAAPPPAPVKKVAIHINGSAIDPGPST